MRIVRALSALAGLMTISCFGSSAHALVQSGKITSTFLSQNYNFGFRITLDTGFSGCANNFAYRNALDDNYQAYVASLISAYYGGKSVTVYYDVDSSGYCHIVEFNVT